MLIAQDQPRVEQWQRLEDGSWRQNVLIGLEATLTLESTPVTVALADLYDRISFPPSAP